jgi:uroporphyrinogen-III synthase
VSNSPCVVLTREPEDNLLLAHALTRRGVPVRELPCVRTRFTVPQVPTEPPAAVAFASRRAVRGYVLAGLHERLSSGAERPLVAAVGEATQAELASAGIPVDLVAVPPTGRALAQALHARLSSDGVVLVPRGSLAGGGLEPELESLGRAFLPLPVYANEAPTLAPLPLFPVAAVFVAAPSAARRLLGHAPWLREHPFLAIGPTTAVALAELGVQRILGPAMGLAAQVELLEAAWRGHPDSSSAIHSIQR